MDCLEKLDETKKKAFFEVMLEEIDIGDTEFSISLMKKAMEILGTPVTQLESKEYLQNTKAFQDAFEFMAQDDVITAVPAVEVNDKLFLKEIPDLTFLRKAIEMRGGKNDE